MPRELNLYYGCCWSTGVVAIWLFLLCLSFQAAATAAIAEQRADGDFELQQQLLKVHRNQTVVVVYADSHMLKYVKNLICYLTPLRLLPHVLFWALDADLQAYFLKHSITSYYDSLYPAVGNALRHSTPAFMRLTKQKFHMVRRVLVLGWNVLFCDADTAWLEDPLAHIPVEGPDMSVTRDVTKSNIGRTPETLDLRCPVVGTRVPNSGVWYVRSQRRTIVAMGELIRRGQTPTHLMHNDQIVLWKFVTDPSVACLVDCYAGACRSNPTLVSVHFLPIALWPNFNMLSMGASVLPTLLRARNRTQPVLAHMNGGKSNSNSKVARLKHYGLWALDSQQERCLEAFQPPKFTTV